MIYQLGALDKWIRQDIHPEKLRPLASDSYVKEYLDFAASEKDRIGAYFRDKAIKGEAIPPSSRLVPAHQAGINQLTYILTDYKADGELPSELKVFYSKVCLLLEEIIQVMEVYLPGYFDPGLPVTHTRSESSRAALNKRLQALQPLYLHPHLDKALCRMATRPLRRFVEDGENVSYRELAYLKELAHALQDLLEVDTAADITYELHLALFQLNFNCPRYVLHFNTWLGAQLSGTTDPVQKQEMVTRHIQAIEQIPFQPAFSWMPGLPALKEQLLTSLKTTYQHLLPQESAVFHAMEQSGARAAGQPKIRLSISVAVLAIFLKLLIMAGVISNENKSEVFRVVADNFSTRKSGQLSYDSLKAKYSAPRTGSERLLKNVLRDLLTFLNGQS